jgi:LysR family hydrogen peroxide-inducible transcriptional activator
MVAMGAGVTILPATMRVGEDLDPHVAIRPFTPPVPTRTVALYYRRGFARPQLIHCLVEVVRATALPGVRYLD